MEQYNTRMKLIGKYFDCTVQIESIFNIKGRNSLLQALKEATKSVEKFQMKYNKENIVTTLKLKCNKNVEIVPY